ncbi:MAG: hypothetical protein P8X90_22275, partial [Desulfobacterales bacterium]
YMPGGRQILGGSFDERVHIDLVCFEPFSGLSKVSARPPAKTTAGLIDKKTNECRTSACHAYAFGYRRH